MKQRTVIVTLELETTAQLRILADRRAWSLVSGDAFEVTQARAQVAQPPKAKARSRRKR